MRTPGILIFPRIPGVFAVHGRLGRWGDVVLGKMFAAPSYCYIQLSVY